MFQGEPGFSYGPQMSKVDEQGLQSAQNTVGVALSCVGMRIEERGDIEGGVPFGRLL